MPLPFEIVDKRQVSKWVPAVAILQNAVPVLPAQYCIGIRSVVLMDQSYATLRGAGRYLPVKNTRRADIELYLQWYEEFDERLKSSIVYLTFHLMSTFLHELYHHSVRQQRLRKKPSAKGEEKAADRWANEAVRALMVRLYPPNKYSEEFERIRAVERELEGCSDASEDPRSGVGAKIDEN